MLCKYLDQGLFPADPEGLPPCAREELRIPLLDERCGPNAAKFRRRIARVGADDPGRSEEAKTKCGIFPHSTSTYAAECVIVRPKDGTVRIYQDYHDLHVLMKTDSGGQGDVQAISDRLRGLKYFPALDFAPEFFQVTIPVAEVYKHKTAFRNGAGSSGNTTVVGLD